MSPDAIRAYLDAIHEAGKTSIHGDPRPVTMALAALTEAVLHLAEVVQRDRVF